MLVVGLLSLGRAQKAPEKPTTPATITTLMIGVDDTYPSYRLGWKIQTQALDNRDLLRKLER
ncbi:hypothetical protein [Archaeoglobus profundus]|uniref:hypothetical protein n=1 Tax=Archaeoglobus profundus TaxID=84156 RepID=UPI00064FF9DC|nr:hypothetical protein [Archaeoglobus profundus]